MSGFLQGLIGDTGCILVSGVVLIATSLTGSSAKEAVAWSQVPRCVRTLQTLLHHRPKGFPVSAGMQCVELAINIFLAHACFTGAAHSDAALAAFVVWMAVNSLDLVIGFLLCPPAFSFSDIDAIFLRALGFSMAAYTAGIVSLLMVLSRSI